jgi:pentatricopeptide repeat protein
MERAVNTKDLRQAQAIFSSVVEEGKKVTEFHYRCLIESYSLHGKFNEAWGVFEDMQAQGIYPNRLHFGSLIRVGICLSDLSVLIILGLQKGKC